MDDRQLAGGSDEEMVVSPRNSGDSDDSMQGNPANQGLAFVGQGASEYQESPSGMSAGTSSTKPSTAETSFSSKSGDLNRANISPEKRRGGTSNEPGSAKKSRAESPEGDSTESSGSNYDSSNEGSAAVEPSNEQSPASGSSEAQQSGPSPDMRYVSNAQRLLLMILEEMMDINGDLDVYEEFRKYFDPPSESIEDESYLVEDLNLYMAQREISWDAECAFNPVVTTNECSTMEMYNSLTELVGRTLILTLVAKKPERCHEIIGEYINLKVQYKKFSEYWRENNVDSLPQESGFDVARFKKITETLLLQTRNAFRELLLHFGEFNIEEAWFVRVESRILPEDKSYLRRRLL